MLNPTEIKSIIASGEGYNVEFKVSIPCKMKEITEEVCVFANASGGIVFIGVNAVKFYFNNEDLIYFESITILEFPEFFFYTQQN